MCTDDVTLLSKRFWLIFCPLDLLMTYNIDDLQKVDISDLQLITIRRVTKSEHPTYKNKCKSDLPKSTSDLQK